MPRKAPTLTGNQIKQIRANLARKASQCGNRLVDNGLGLLKEKAGEGYELTAGQINSLVSTLKVILPAQQEVEDTTDTLDVKAAHEEHAELKARMREKVLASLTPEETAGLQSKQEIAH